MAYLQLHQNVNYMGRLCESVVNTGYFLLLFTVISLISASPYNLSNPKLQQMHEKHMRNLVCLRNIYPFNPHHRNVKRKPKMSQTFCHNKATHVKKM